MAQPQRRGPGVCIPEPDAPGRERARHVRFTDHDVKRAEAETGLHAYRPPPQPGEPLQSGSFQDTERDVHGIYETFVGRDLDKIDLARPPYAKRPSDHVLEEMIDWEREEAKRQRALRRDKVRRFLAAMATHARVNLDQFLQKIGGDFGVGQELLQRQEQAQLGLTPEPGIQQQQPTFGTQPITMTTPRLRTLRQSVELPPSGANVPKRRVRKKKRADLTRRERIEAYDARKWLERVEVIGEYVISDRAITAINDCYTRIVGNVPDLNGVHVKHFMFTEHVLQRFAELCGLWLNYLDFRSRRTWIELSMNNIYIGSMNNIICDMASSVVWDTKQRKLLFIPGHKKTECVPVSYTRISHCCTTPMQLQLCPRGARSRPCYPLVHRKKKRLC